jgi:hypothetical protein
MVVGVGSRRAIGGVRAEEEMVSVVSGMGVSSVIFSIAQKGYRLPGSDAGNPMAACTHS